ncbi:MAG TPA: hypothetical protein VKK19_12855 [Candidatus Dormibacteraeota bacterium]|nr:hypothetical protein [Candidatus Dormibacteraeota bacterium]
MFAKLYRADRGDRFELAYELVFGTPGEAVIGRGARGGVATIEPELGR